MAESRRVFLSSTAAGAALAAAGYATAAESTGEGSLLKPGDTVLFQGDSITDAGRKKDGPRDPNEHSTLGNGYAMLAASSLLAASPDAGHKFHNRGISGNKVHQLAERWQEDCLDIKPDVLSILIGVNDIWHWLNGNYDGTIETYRTDYRALLERTRKQLPDTKLVICEPFVLKTGAVNERWFPTFDEFRAAAKEMADQYADAFVPFQTMFDNAVNIAEPSYWAGDGVHPSSAGAALMAHAWVEAVS